MHTSSRSSQVRRPRSSRRLATRLIGIGRHFIHTSLFSSDCAHGGRGRGCGYMARAGQTPRGWVEAARTVSTSEMSAIGWSSGTCAHSSASTCTARGRGVQGEQHSRSRHRESGRLRRPGPASHLLASRPLLRGLLLGHRDEARPAKGARPTLVRALGTAQGGAGACGARRGRAHSIESIQYIGLRLLEGSCTSLRFRSCRGTRTRRKGQHGCSQGRCPWGASGGGQARAPCALRGGGSRAPRAADGR